jgi:hypothetical protein
MRAGSGAMTDHPPIFTPLIGPSPHANPEDADILISWFSADDWLCYYRSIVMSIKITMILEVVDRNPGRMSMDESQESQDYKSQVDF